jgi:hypothetical protein
MSFASDCIDLWHRIGRKLFELKHPDLVTLPCPICGQGIPNFSVLIHFGPDWAVVPFPCPSCGTLLCVPSGYRWWTLAGWTALALVIPCVLRIKQWYFWLAAAALSWNLLAALESVYVRILFPPRILRCDPPLRRDPNDLSIKPWRK